MTYMQLGDAQLVLDYLKIIYREHYNKAHEEVRKRNIGPIKSRIPLPPVFGGKARTTPIDEKKNDKPQYIIHDDNYGEIRGMEQYYAEKMIKHFKQAAKAHQRGDGRTAKLESQEGNKYKSMYLGEKYSNIHRTLASKNNKLKRDKCIDLHGLHENEVEQVLDNYIQEIYHMLSTGEIAPNSGARRGHCVTVITGKGNNSRLHTPVVKNRVRAYLREHGIGYKEGEDGGYFTISLV